MNKRFDEVAALRPDEKPAQRFDRNWSEILQELRVLQTGTQILTAFLLALAFQPAFSDLTQGQQTFYLILVGLAGTSAVIALAPVALHRVLFRAGMKRQVVRYGHRAFIIALAVVSALLAGVVAFVFDIVVGEPASWIAGAVMAALVLLLWVVVPLTFRMNGKGDHEDEDEDEPAGAQKK